MRSASPHDEPDWNGNPELRRPAIRWFLLAQLNRDLPLYRAFHFRDGGALTGVSAGNLREFADAIASAPAGVLRHHSREGDFSRWLGDLSEDPSLRRTIAQLETGMASDRGDEEPARAREEMLALLRPLCLELQDETDRAADSPQAQRVQPGNVQARRADRRTGRPPAERHAQRGEPAQRRSAGL